ncbi:probable BOI-related E3 ubiquitin-protein ligase 3 [Chenopodium quinoa]|uniref:probable BOI-related E3 ubiquitin-protein ligase 3 n=1 Tax=Chenopodium quinoa TaxID=63459 RepID=UPI000B79996D|nr:probable BOI-related E3 ubiquitin-protein ligase 3 [Chenopodium quinoa]
MAVETEIFSENLGFSQDYMIPTFPNLSNPLQNHQPLPQTQPQRYRFEPGMEMGMGMGMGYNNVGNNQGIGSSSTAATTAVTENSLPFSALLDQHKREVDLYLHVQGEKLKQAIHQQKRQQMQYLVNSFESRTMAIMKEKDENLEKLRGKAKILEDFLKKSEQETEMWQSIAREKEEMVIELNNMLFVIQQNLVFSTPPRNDIANGNHGGEDDVESVNECEAIDKNDRGNLQENHQEVNNKMVCKWCNSGKLCVVFLPCKHLCCCRNCESVLGLCPVCYSAKQDSMEVFF